MSDLNIFKHLDKVIQRARVGSAGLQRDVVQYDVDGVTGK
jgi:hypothetical protein